MSEDRMLTNHEITGRWPWGTIFGFSVVGLYIGFTFIAFTQYPGTVSPIDTYLSMLGNAELSPQGAIFYNLGVILTGLAALPFFIAISSAYSPYCPRRLLIIGLLAGLINGLAISMSGIYAQHVNMNAHVTSSYIIFFSLIPMLLAYSLAFWGMKDASKHISLYGFIVCAISVFFLATLLSGHLGPGLGPILEWVVVFSYMAWFALISRDVLIRSRAERGA